MSETQVDDEVEVRVELPVVGGRKRVRVQVSLYGEQGERFLRLKEESGLTNSQLASVLMMIGLRYIWAVMYPAESLSDDMVDRLAGAFSKYMDKG